MTTREQQEHLNLAGIHVAIDGDPGPETAFGLTSYAVLFPTTPLGHSFGVLKQLGHAPVSATATATLSQVMLRVGRWYRDAGAREVGGNNRGPWVRHAMDGAEGEKALWCAGFTACTCLHDAELILNEARVAAAMPPLHIAKRYHSPSCAELLERARADARLVTDVAKARPGWPALLLAAGTSHHIGILQHWAPNPNHSILTLEGNAPDDSDRGLSDRVAWHVRDARQWAFIDIDIP